MSRAVPNTISNHPPHRVVRRGCTFTWADWVSSLSLLTALATVAALTTLVTPQAARAQQTPDLASALRAAPLWNAIPLAALPEGEPRSSLLPDQQRRILPPPSTATRHPDLFAPEPIYPRRNNFLFDGAADVRYRTRTANDSEIDRTVGSYIAATRLTGEFIRAGEDGAVHGGVRAQLLVENDNVGTALNKVRASELYGFYHFPFPGVSATVRGGQFVLPFGLAAVYDTPLQPIQTLYNEAIGLRVDTGAMLEGEYGIYHYAASVTTGSGPDRTRDARGHVVAFRLSRAVETRLGRFQVGGSLLTGTLPVTNFAYDLPPSGFVGTENYVQKSRFAGDGEYFLGKLIARGEVIFGADNQDSVYGYFGETDYQFRKRTQAVAYLKTWDFPVKPQQKSELGAGLNYDLGGGILLRSLYEFERDTPQTAGVNPTVIRRITLQTRLNF